MCALLVLLALTLPAWGRDDGRYAGSPYKAWYHDQHNDQGQWCCDESDGHRFDGNYKVNQDGSVTAWDEGRQYEIPAFMVLKGANPTGGAVWWFTTDYHGERTSYCFSPGTMG